jgi:hypothetical protein
VAPATPDGTDPREREISLAILFSLPPKDSSDLSGVTPSTYDPKASNLQASVGQALYDAKYSIRTLGRVDETRTIIYDMANLKKHVFKHHNGCYWKDDKPSSPRSDGQLDFLPGGELRVQRNTTDGRYEIELRPNGFDNPSIRKKHEAVQRVFRVTCEARVEDGDHTLRFVLKDIKTDKWTASESRKIKANTWEPVEVYVKAQATMDLLFRIDDETPSKAPSSICIRNLVIAEELD